jgi:hypothetical protein
MYARAHRHHHCCVTPALAAERKGVLIMPNRILPQVGKKLPRLLRGSHAPVVTRREFTLQSALALLAGVVITVDGCGGGNDSPAAPTPNPGQGQNSGQASDVTGAISGNHGHKAVITGAQITAANAIALDIQGDATHPHTVEVTQAELRTLQSRQAISKTSSTDSGHQHGVTFTPA